MKPAALRSVAWLCFLQIGLLQAAWMGAWGVRQAEARVRFLSPVADCVSHLAKRIGDRWMVPERGMPRDMALESIKKLQARKLSEILPSTFSKMNSEPVFASGDQNALFNLDFTAFRPTDPEIEELTSAFRKLLHHHASWSRWHPYAKWDFVNFSNWYLNELLTQENQRFALLRLLEQNATLGSLLPRIYDEYIGSGAIKSSAWRKWVHQKLSNPVVRAAAITLIAVGIPIKAFVVMGFKFGTVPDHSRALTSQITGVSLEAAHQVGAKVGGPTGNWLRGFVLDAENQVKYFRELDHLLKDLTIEEFKIIMGEEPIDQAPEAVKIAIDRKREAFRRAQEHWLELGIKGAGFMPSSVQGTRGAWWGLLWSAGDIGRTVEMYHLSYVNYRHMAFQIRSSLAQIKAGPNPSAEIQTEVAELEKQLELLTLDQERALDALCTFVAISYLHDFVFADMSRKWAADEQGGHFVGGAYQYVRERLGVSELFERYKVGSSKALGDLYNTLRRSDQAPLQIFDLPEAGAGAPSAAPSP